MVSYIRKLSITMRCVSIDNLNMILGPSGSGNPLAIVGPGGDILGPTDERESSTQSNEQQVR